ncbi:MAG: HAD family hydrolase [Vicinamibacteria bacterium]|nr:HAD family hydrolase [Vicinamibacteria bacterium]
MSILPERQTPHRSFGRLRAVLFDWDGTLVDSAESSYRCYRLLFQGFGIDFDRDLFERAYSPDWYATYRIVGLPESRWEEADARWLDLYAQTPSALVYGAHDVLGRLVKAGLRLGLVTSGDRCRVLREATALGVLAFLDVVICAHDAPCPKPAPDPLLRALSLLTIPASDALYVGDSPEDVFMARAAGVFAIGVPGGFPNREALRISRPDYLAPDLSDAVSYIIEHEMAVRTSEESSKKTPSESMCSSPEGVSNNSGELRR